MQVEEVFVSPETTYDGTAILHSSSLSSMQVIYSPQNGGFLTQPPSIIDELQPTTPAEFAQTEGLLTQVSNCITQSFDNEQANNENPVSQTTTIDENELRTMGVCAVPCSITGRVAFEHPTWGASRLLTVVALDAADWEAHMLAVDSDSNIRWRYDTDEWAELAPANDTPGKSGNIFITYNPGRYDGIVVLQPSTEGFNDFDTLPENDYFAGRFYGASIADVNSDGVFEVVIDQMTCAPECTTDIEYFWDGINYAEK